jgi:organic hydroperoxide reductase OsmC/OhrA
MHPYPHRYRVTAATGLEGDVVLASAGLAPLNSAPPIEFDGPGNRWSPETLLVGAIADCFVLTFRAIARAGQLPWDSLDCEVEGLLARDQGVPRFTGFTVRARLSIPAGADAVVAQQALYKAEKTCLISNSLTGERTFSATVDVEVVA